MHSVLSSDWQESADDLVSEICHKVDHNEVGSTISTSEIETDDISSTVQQSCNVIQENSSSVSGRVSFPELHKFRASHRKNFVFAHLNVNGLNSKYSEIHEILKSEYTDFLAIGESKLYPELQMGFKVQNYSFYRRDRANVNERNVGGGLAVYISSVIPHRQRQDISFNQDGIEDMTFEVVLKKQKWFFVTMYRPPSVSIAALRDALNYLYTRCENESNNIVILGDLNVNFCLESNPLKDDLDIYSLKNIVKGPTCFKSQTNPSAVDVILMNNARQIASCLNIDIGVSDHHTMVLAATKMYAPKADRKVIYYNSYKNFNETEYLTDLACAPFQTGMIFDDLDDHVWYHNTLLSYVISLHAPKKKRIIRSRQLVYMNGELRRAINVKGMLKRKMNKVHSKENITKYRFQRNLVTSLKRKSLKTYFDKRCTENTTRQTPG